MLELILEVILEIFLRSPKKHPVIAVMIGVAIACVALALSGLGSSPWFFVAVIGFGALTCVGLWLLREK